MAKQPPIFREAIEALERLERAEGPVARESILEINQDNLALKAIIRMAVGPDRYFVRPSVNIACNSSLAPVASWRAFKILTEKLRNRKLTGTAAKKEVRVFLGNCRPLLMKWYCRILNRDLRCGVNIKTVAKVFGSTFLLSDSSVGVNWQYSGCALAKKYEDVYRVTRRGECKPEFPLAVEAKYDGERANLICFPRDNEIFVLTRSGKRRQPIEQVEQFRQQVLDFCRQLNEGVNPERPLFLDGEFLARKWNDTSSIVRRTVNFNPEKFLREIRVILWDWAPLDQYLVGQFDSKWRHRKSELLRAAGATRPTIELQRFAYNVYAAGHTVVYTAEQLQEEYARRLDAGHEGVILKNPEAPHVFKRTPDLVKLKPEDDITARIVDVVAGEGQHGAVVPAVFNRVKRLMKRYGPVKKTQQYLHCKTDDAMLFQETKQALEGDVERRLSGHRKGFVSFRYGERMGYLVVELDDGRRFHVGGGFTHKVGQDQRAWFWRHRDMVVGLKIDFRQQKGTTADTVSRFPRFVRLREDI